MRAFLALALVLMALPAMAQAVPPEWNPPARFDRPFAGEIYERRLPPEQTAAACARMMAHFKSSLEYEHPSVGCSVRLSPVHCTLFYIDRPHRGTTPEAVRRHELGHCSGWPPNHPD